MHRYNLYVYYLFVLKQVKYNFNLSHFFFLGKRLGELEMKLGLSDIITKYEVLPCEKTEFPIKLAKGLMVKPKNGVWLSLKPIIPS